MKYVIFTSCGNDSLALTQFAHERGLNDVCVAYSNTGWAVDYWADRVARVEEWVHTLGFDFVEIQSEGMEALVKRKNAWPRGGGGKFQFCTEALKEGPARKWLDDVDPDLQAVCMIGIRREEGNTSLSRRSTFPEWTYSSERHGGRELWAPLVRYTEKMRNDLLLKTPFDPLPYRSKECYPCVNAGQRELRHLSENRIKTIELLEKDMGTNGKGNAIVMFSPRRHNGAIGIRQVVNDAQKDNDDLFPSKICDSGWCGD